MTNLLLARRHLLQQRLRLVLSVSSVGLAVMLIVLLNGLMAGVYRQISSYLDHAPGSVVLAQEDVRNLLGATSLLPRETVYAARQVQGVGSVSPILSRFVILDLHGKKAPAYLAGYDAGRGGGPWALADGREPGGPDELVLDRVLAERHGVRVGDLLPVMGRRFLVSGLSNGTTSWMTSFVFMTREAAGELLGNPGGASFVLVAPAAGVVPEELRARLAALPGSDAVLKREIIENDIELLGGILSAPLRLMAGIAFVIGVLVVGVVIFTAVAERRRDYGVLKAVGARNGRLYAVVLIQALLPSLVGALLGVGLSLAAGRLIMALRPQFLITLEPTAVGQALGAGLLMALAAALFPARLLARLEPADVFRRAS